MKNVAKVEIGNVGDNIVITIPKSLIRDGMLDLEEEYEVIIAPKETFKKDIFIAKAELSKEKGKTSPLESENSATP